jgi:hypothetical protein
MSQRYRNNICIYKYYFHFILSFGRIDITFVKTALFGKSEFK